MRLHQHESRRGAVLPLLAISLVGLMGFLALAIDIGVLAVARNQAQNAADIAALSGARTLSGTSSNNYNVTAALAMAQTAATSNSILNTSITAAQVTTNQAGIYRYSTTNQRFQAVFNSTLGTNESYGAVQVSLTTSQPTFFSKVLGVSSMTVGATATAVHKPRDISIVLDFSGSMGYSSQVNYNYTQTQSLSPDSEFPQFGPWSVFAGSGMVLNYNSPPSSPSNLTTYTPTTPMQRVFGYVDSSGYLYAPNNLTMTTAAGPPLVGNFLLSDQTTNAFVNSSSASGSFPTFTNVHVTGASNPTAVCTPAPATFVSDNATNFVGDSFPLRYGQIVAPGTAPTPSQYAQCVADILGITRPSKTTYNTICPAWCANGYDATYSKVSGPNSSGLVTATPTVKNPPTFQGFTMGPGYWGKTFYMWPPDPRTPVGTIGDATYVAGDWRQRFFLARTGSSQNMQDNSVFWSSGGAWNSQNPGSSAAYIINYNAVLAWLTGGPQTLPASLCAGRTVYYSSIPTSISVSQSTGIISSGATTDEVFWKDYIDYVFGAGQYTASSSMYGTQSANSNTGGGSTLYYNNPSSSNLSPQIVAKSNLTSYTGSITGATKASPIVITSSSTDGLATGNTITISGVGGNTAANGTWTIKDVTATSFSLNGSTGNATYTSGGTWTLAPYMHYADTPVHPRMQFWFGPLSMLAYMNDFVAGNWNWHPGTSYEAQSWQLKTGINAALTDIQSEHPNDLASLIYYSGLNTYSTARVSMGKSFSTMQNALFFPYSLLSSLSSASSTALPYSTSSGSSSNPAGINDISLGDIPNAGSSTCPEMGFMAAYNQFSNATDTSVSPNVTYTGRQGASKIVIFETDGCPNTTCSGSLTGSGTSGNWYYKTIGSADDVGLSTSINVTPKTGACTIVQQIAASTTASKPGFSTTRYPAYVHAIAFGDLFESSSTSTLTPAALRFLCAVQIYGNTSAGPGGTVTSPGTMASWYTDTLDYNTYYVNIEPWKVVTGSYSTRISNISECMQRIMQSGVQVALIQ